MHRSTPILLFMVMFSFPALVVGQEDVEESEEFEANEVETPSGFSQSIYWSPSAVSVITWDDILLSGAASLEDLLRRVPGLDVFYMKTYFPLISARGRTDLSNSRVLMLVDGREELIDLSGYPLWGAVTFDLEDIRRIEVIRGPSSTLYGTNAISAVVNITTISKEPSSDAEILVSGGELGRLRVYVEHSEVWTLQEGDLSYGFHFGWEGKRSQSDTRDKAPAPQLHGHLRYRTPELLDLTLQAGTSIGSGGGGLVAIDMGDIAMVDPYIVWAKGKGVFFLGEDATLSAQIYYTHAYSDLRYRTGIYAYDNWIGDIEVVSWTTDVIDSRVNLDLIFSDALRLLAGTHLRFNLMEGKNAAMTDEEEIRGAGFVQLQWREAWFQLTGGLRLDFNLDANPALCPRLVAVARPWPNHSFRLGYSAAFRKPSDLESRVHLMASEYNQAMPEAVELMEESVGNSGLKNETAHAFEAGWRAGFPDLRLELAVNAFFNMHRNTIALYVDVPQRLGGVPDLGHSTIRYQNDGPDVNVLGTELEVYWYPLGDMITWANLTLKKASYDGPSDEMFSEPLFRLNLGGGYRPASGLFVDIALHYVSDYTTILIVPTDPVLGREPFEMGDNWLLIGNLGYRLELPGTRFLDAGLAIRQPLGVPVREVAGIPRPRTIEVEDISDFGGEILTRLIWAYVRWSY